MGLNWQHCNHSVFFPTYSLMNNIIKLLEGFGDLDKLRDVTIDMVISEGQTRVLEALQQKTR